MTLNELEDVELASLLRKGSTAAFEAIYLRYWEKLYAFIFRNLESREESEEILQDIMLSLWSNKSSAEINNLGVYLFIAARNQINKFIRREINQRKYREFQIMSRLEEVVPIDRHLEEAEFKAQLEKVLASMPEKTAQIFKMSKIENFPVREIAKEMDLSEKAIEYHITKSMKIIRNTFKGLHSAN
ncbi:sigma-70 family RNA polymerase sigma factor [Marinilongibacter aquaticus]|uniref:sigma-70 family RNA polymerase sigma factor n=1 Tax=Marinilongibacter aquaticus TaxID=2975157 RepID=UPI0021BDADE0|nr:sigma-70 family RNA polymerase sigma factor [Marinilongibacter aquaticus]UBM59924.1 sigma-70 family RNA polymerase sigma factor [Marinilongibacter aquaticus]